MFSGRTPGAGLENELARRLAARTRPLLDLTVTNPTAVELAIPSGLDALADPRGAWYRPDPRGLLAAREAVCRYYAAHGVPAVPGRLVLTASTSEAYSWLLKLLCGPGDVVLVPAPSYPLLDALATLEAVELHRYRLDRDDGYRLHAAAVERELEGLEAMGKRARAVVIVNPNNPTGCSLSSVERDRLLEVAARRGLAVLSDEVFLDYRLAPRRDDVKVLASGAGAPASERERPTLGALVFSLGGLSKTAALPQLKLGWILADGPPELLGEALGRLEWIADAYLSVSTPVQLALPRLLEDAPRAIELVTARLRQNLAALSLAFPEASPVRALAVSGGWSAVLRVPATEPEESLVLRLLDEHDLLVHPGYFFDFPEEAYLVVSLLPPPRLFAAAVERLARALH